MSLNFRIFQRARAGAQPLRPELAAIARAAAVYSTTGLARQVMAQRGPGRGEPSDPAGLPAWGSFRERTGGRVISRAEQSGR